MHRAEDAWSNCQSVEWFRSPAAGAKAADDPVELTLSAIPAHLRSQAVIGNFYHYSCNFPVE